MEPSREERDRQALGPPISPEPARAEDAPGARTLHEESVRSWREHGYALVDGVFPADLIERARAESAAPFPTPGSAAAEAVTDFGSLGLMEFPTRSRAVNEITLHPRLLDATSQLLGVPIRDLRLTQSEVWPKYGRTGKAGGNLDNYDQRIHIDYPNHSLTHPAAFETPESVALLVYFDDIDEVGGATQIVAALGSGRSRLRRATDPQPRHRRNRFCERSRGGRGRLARKPPRDRCLAGREPLRPGPLGPLPSGHHPLLPPRRLAPRHPDRSRCLAHRSKYFVQARRLRVDQHRPPRLGVVPLRSIEAPGGDDRKESCRSALRARLSRAGQRILDARHP